MSTALKAESFPTELSGNSWGGPKVEVRGPCFPKEALVYILITVDTLPSCRKNWGCIEFKKDPKTLRIKREKHKHKVMSWERVYPFRSTTINQNQTPVALLEKDSILWFKHDKSYCKRCVVWGWGVCSLAVTKSSRNSLYFHLYRFAMNRFQLTPLAVAITTFIDWYNDLPRTFYFPLCLCPSYLLWLRN